MSLKLFSFLLALFCWALIPAISPAQRQPLEKGPFNIGYNVISIPYDTITLILNLWYPTQKQTGTTILLSDYVHSHLRKMPDTQYKNEVPLHMDRLKKMIKKNFGSFEENKWRILETKTCNAFFNAPYHVQSFPLILGRNRAFSTVLTNEYLASHGYIIGMLNGITDHPPSNKILYQKQLNDELNYYRHLTQYLSTHLKITTDKTGLMGFSGGGFSQFLAPMIHDQYKAVVLLESGVFIEGDLFDVVSSHPDYEPSKYRTPLLILYNKSKFESSGSARNFYMFKGERTFLKFLDIPVPHHWDFATEGTVSSFYLENRLPDEASFQLSWFRKMNISILQFFKEHLK